MAAPKFKVGDKVKCMVAKSSVSGGTVSVWDGDHMNKVVEGTKRWTAGIVTESTVSSITAWFTDDSGYSFICSWPYIGHELYSKLQWGREGWLQLIKDDAVKTVETKSFKCSCELSTIMQFGCRCGAFHSEQKMKGKL